jgi:hypothetical protein
LSIHAARRIIRHRSKELPQRTVLSDATNHTLYDTSEENQGIGH